MQFSRAFQPSVAPEHAHFAVSLHCVRVQNGEFSGAVFFTGVTNVLGEILVYFRSLFATLFTFSRRALEEQLRNRHIPVDAAAHVALRHVAAGDVRLDHARV